MPLMDIFSKGVLLLFLSFLALLGSCHEEDTEKIENEERGLTITVEGNTYTFALGPGSFGQIQKAQKQCGVSGCDITINGKSEDEESGCVLILSREESISPGHVYELGDLYNPNNNVRKIFTFSFKLVTSTEHTTYGSPTNEPNGMLEITNYENDVLSAKFTVTLLKNRSTRVPNLPGISNGLVDVEGIINELPLSPN